MLTRLVLRHFKRFAFAEIELGSAVVFIGPNNSGKTTALQALALWDIGVRSWLTKRSGNDLPQKRPGVTINRKDLLSVPTPTADMLWHELHTRDTVVEEGRSRTQNVRMDVVVSGVSEGRTWTCGMEFDYSNSESLVCRPIREEGYRESKVRDARFTNVPNEAGMLRVAYLPPMSGLADREHVKQTGEIGFLIGQGQTAQVLRNLCLRVFEDQPTAWYEIVSHIDLIFGCRLHDPERVESRSEIVMEYTERRTRLDLSSAGRGLQQVLLLLTHMHANTRSVLLLDEPDAHLEVLRQRQVYNLITETARKTDSQIIAASHSEIVMNEAADRGIVVAFVGRPHRIDDRSTRTQVARALKEVGFDQYYMAEARGWVLYLEGSTDLAILSAFAKRLRHPAADVLVAPFVHYVGNVLNKAIAHHAALREAIPLLPAIAILDQLPDRGSPPYFQAMRWQRREIENYLCQPETLLAYARGSDGDSLFDATLSHRREELMNERIRDLVPPIALRDRANDYWKRIKATDDFLDPLFEDYFKALELPNMFRKRDYFELAGLVPEELIDPEIVDKLDRIVDVAARAVPAQ